MQLNKFLYHIFRDLSIQNKLRAISIMTGLVILFVSSSVLVVNQIITLKHNMSTDLLTLADIVGRNIEVGLTFEIQSTVEETLSSLNAKPNIIGAYVFTPDGVLFADYHRNDFQHQKDYNLNTLLPSKHSEALQHQGETYFFSQEKLTVYKIVQADGAKIGVVSIESDLMELNQRLYWSFFVLFIDMILSLILALIIAAGLQTLFTRPIYQLLNVISTVTEKKDYSLRAQKLSKDEIGRLIEGFNKMLSAIERRDEQINTLNQKLNSENLRMSSELDVTRKMQEMVLPSAMELKEIDGLEIVGFMQPANEVGGDYYDVLHEGEHLKIGIGDVTGHGLESGVIMLMVQTAVRSLLLAGIHDVKNFLNIVNRTIYANVQRMGSEKNLTLALLDYQNGNIQITGQHEEILVVRKDGSSEWVDTLGLGFMIGLESDIQSLISSKEIYLAPGDGIVLYTDGITEAHNVHIKQAVYGEERLREQVCKHWHQPLEAIRDTVIADVLKYAGSENIFDDLTLVIVRRVI